MHDRPRPRSATDMARAGRRIVIICKGNVGTMMSSPGIRALNIARVLSRALPDARVTLATPSASDLTPDAPFRLVTYSARTLPRLVLDADIVISQGFAPTLLPAFFGRTFVMDFFTNFLIEGLEYRIDQVAPSVRQAWLETQRVYLNLQLTLADFVICANERQRDAWLGMMSCLGLIPGSVYDRDTTLEKLVAVAPYGIRPEAPSPAPAGAERSGRPMPLNAPPFPASAGEGRGVQPTLVSSPLSPDRVGGEGAGRLILWNGGILRWYDPLTLIRAVARLVPERPDVRLLFLGTRYPVTGFDPGIVRDEAEALARRLGLLGTHVLFNEGWLPYDESGRAMMKADIGVSTYFDNLETHFSYRTRLVDFLWAGVPVVCTRGDVIAEMVERRGLGLTVPARDVDALTAALARLLDDRAFHARCRANLVAVREELTWERTLAPLVEFCRQPRPIARGKWSRAPDLLSRTARYAYARALETVKHRLYPRPLFPRRNVQDTLHDAESGSPLPV